MPTPVTAHSTTHSRPKKLYIFFAIVVALSILIAGIQLYVGNWRINIEREESTKQHIDIDVEDLDLDNCTDARQSLESTLHSLMEKMPTFIDEAGDAESRPKRTKYKCRHFADTSGYCMYNNVCLERFDGDPEVSMVIIDDAKVGQDVVGDENYRLSDIWLHDSRPEIEQPIPYRGEMHARYGSSDIFEKARWFDDWGVFTGVDMAQTEHNVFHWAIYIASIFAARVNILEELLPLDGVMPALLDMSPNSVGAVFKNVFLNRFEGQSSNWMSEFLHTAIGDPTQVKYTYLDSTEIPTEDRPWCFKKAVVPGPSLRLFQGPRDVERFRRIAAKRNGVEYKGQNSDNVVTYVKRESRGARNDEEVTKALSDVFGPKLQIVHWEKASFHTQLQQMANTAVLISSHGAQLTNSIFMPGGGAVVEFLPPRWPYLLYSRIAMYAGHYHFPIHGTMNDWDNDYRFDLKDGRGDVGLPCHRDCISTFECNFAMKQYGPQPNVDEVKRISHLAASIVIPYYNYTDSDIVYRDEK